MTNKQKIIAMVLLAALSQSPRFLSGVELPAFSATESAGIDQQEQYQLLCGMMAERVLESEHVRTSGQLFDFWHVASELAFSDLDIESEVQAEIDSIWPDIRRALLIDELQVELDEKSRQSVAEIFAEHAKE